mgnify:FL=1
MTNSSRKMNSSSPGAYPGSDVHDRAGDHIGSGFDLRETLGDTKVRETTFAEFQKKKKKVGKPVG